MTKITYKAIQTALKMDTGETMFLPCESRQEQSIRLRTALQELSIISKTDPISASTLLINSLMRDGRLWVVLKKITASPAVVFIKGEGGAIRRVDLGDDTERQRRIYLMVKDGLTLSEIGEFEGDLTEEEVNFIKRGGK